MSRLAALFDLDGTLTESAPGIMASMRHALARLGHTLDPREDLSWVIGPPLEDNMARLLAPYGDARVAEAVAAYREHYGREGLFQNALYPGIAEALDAFAAAGWELFVATSKRADFARRILAHFHLADRFRHVYGGDGGALDHKPELIRHILASEGLPPERTVMIGDRRFDIEGARANGVAAVGVRWGYGDDAELGEADAVAATPGDLLPVAAAQVRAATETAAGE